MTQEQIRQIAEIIAASAMICTKEVLTSDEAAKYMGIKISHLYKLTMRGEIPFSKPNGKMCYFKRTDIENWMMSNPIATASDLADRANEYCVKNKANI